MTHLHFETIILYMVAIVAGFAGRADLEIIYGVSLWKISRTPVFELIGLYSIHCKLHTVCSVFNTIDFG